MSMEERTEVVVTATQEIREAVKVTGALAVAEAYEIDCAEVAQSLADERKGWATRIDRLKLLRTAMIEPVKTALEKMKKNAEAWFDPAIQDFEAARDLAGRKMLDWDRAEQARIDAANAAREAENRRLRQEAEAKAAAERARGEEAAREARRKAQEAEDALRKAQAEGNAKAAAAAAAARAKAQEAEHAATENAEAKAQEFQLTAAAQASAAPVVESTKITGQAVKMNWVAELKEGLTEDTAKAMIVAEAGARPELLALLKLDVPAINKLAKALKQAMRVPGYVAANKPQLSGDRK